MMKVSIIIPCFNEAQNIEKTLLPLQKYRESGSEIIVVDGGSRDNTIEFAQPLADKLLISKPGRATQMNIGAEQSEAETLLFLHADTLLPESMDRLLSKALAEGYQWGRFNVRLSGSHFVFRIIETLMNWRSCLTGIATGDQAIFVKREIFEQIKGFPEIKLMEDIVLSKKLKRLSRPACIQQRVITSSRKWENNGIIKTVLLMWRLRLQYFFGVSADKLHAKYYR